MSDITPHEQWFSSELRRRDDVAIAEFKRVDALMLAQVAATEAETRRVDVARAERGQRVDAALVSLRDLTAAEFRRVEALQAERALRSDAALEAYALRGFGELEAHKEKDDARHAAELEAAAKLERDTERRLSEMNNFREQINHERAFYLSRDMYERENDSLSERVKSLEIMRGNQDGKAAAYASVIALAVIIVQIALHFWR